MLHEILVFITIYLAIIGGAYVLAHFIDGLFKKDK